MPVTHYRITAWLWLGALLLLPEPSRGTPCLAFTPVPLPAVPESTLLAKPRYRDMIDDSTSPDPKFGKMRWPCIIKGNLWAQRQAQSTLPAHAKVLMPQLKSQFIKEGLPEELAWVAEVESTLNTNAVSGSGARGLFQFKTEAARRFGILKESHDFRSEPEKSAKAAAQYLNRLYAQFKDWTLSVAAYNAGEGCVSRLLKKHDTQHYSIIAAELPPQTQVYVIKVMTTLALRENSHLSALPPPM